MASPDAGTVAVHLDLAAAFAREALARERAGDQLGAARAERQAIRAVAAAVEAMARSHAGKGA